MIPLKTFVSERRAANLLAQIRWRDGIYCPRCRTESLIRHGSYRVFQRYLCEDCGRTFNDKTGTVFEHSTIPLRKWYLAVYTYIRLNTSIRQLDAELAVSYKTVYRRVQRFLRALDAPRPQGLVEIDEMYVNAGKKGRSVSAAMLTPHYGGGVIIIVRFVGFLLAGVVVRRELIRPFDTDQPQIGGRTPVYLALLKRF